MIQDVAGPRVGRARRNFLRVRRAGTRKEGARGFRKSRAARSRERRCDERSVQLLPAGARHHGRRHRKSARACCLRWPGSTRSAPTWRRQSSTKKRNSSPRPKPNCARRFELAPDKVEPVLELAQFLARRGRYEESDQAFQAGRESWHRIHRGFFSHTPNP